MSTSRWRDKPVTEGYLTGGASLIVTILDALFILPHNGDFYTFPNIVILFIAFYTLAIIKRKNYKRMVQKPTFTLCYSSVNRTNFARSFLFDPIFS